MTLCVYRALRSGVARHEIGMRLVLRDREA